MMSRKQQADNESPPAVPRWVKGFGIAALAVVLLVVLLMATGHAGEHGPDQHLPGAHAAPALQQP